MLLNVLITIDTEVYPVSNDWKSTRLESDWRRDICGETARGSFGVPYQLEVFARNGIKAVFFVEGLHASSPWVGISPLRDLVQTIYAHGQEVQLHLHPEWVPHLAVNPLEDRGYLLTSYSEDEQYRLLQMATENLVKAGAKRPTAFRAGDYAANNDTLRALSRTGFQYDTSYNIPYLGTTCGIDCQRLWQPARLESGIWEVPVSCFQDRKGHYRHCQICACSTEEIKNSILQAVEARWQTYVLVSHSFEMIGNRRSARPTWPRWQVIKRFEAECEWLAGQTATVATSHFADLDLIATDTAVPIQGRTAHILWRNMEQVADRITSRFNL